MCRGHDERYILAGDFLIICRVGIVSLHSNGCLDWTGHGCVLHHFPELVDIICTVVAMFGPDIQKFIQATVVFGVFLSVVGRRIAQYFDDIRLTGPGQGQEGR